MNLKDTLAKLDSMLDARPKMKLVKMTMPQFESYAVDQLAKAKGEMEEDDKEKGAEKAKKRLAHLRAVMKLLVAKAEGPAETNSATASPSGSEYAAAIPVYDEGFEPPTYMPTLEEAGNLATGGQGTQGDVAPPFSNNGDLQSRNPMNPAPGGGGPTMEGGAGTQVDNTIFANPQDQSGKNPQTPAPTGSVTKTAFEKACDGLAAELKSLTGKSAVEKGLEALVSRNETPKNDDPTIWPKDCADPKFLKEGVAKRAEEWGRDPWAASK